MEFDRRSNADAYSQWQIDNGILEEDCSLYSISYKIKKFSYDVIRTKSAIRNLLNKLNINFYIDYDKNDRLYNLVYYNNSPLVEYEELITYLILHNRNRFTLNDMLIILPKLHSVKDKSFDFGIPDDFEKDIFKIIDNNLKFLANGKEIFDILKSYYEISKIYENAKRNPLFKELIKLRNWVFNNDSEFVKQCICNEYKGRTTFEFIKSIIGYKDIEKLENIIVNSIFVNNKKSIEYVFSEISYFEFSTKKNIIIQRTIYKIYKEKNIEDCFVASLPLLRRILLNVFSNKSKFVIKEVSKYNNIEQLLENFYTQSGIDIQNINKEDTRIDKYHGYTSEYNEELDTCYADEINVINQKINQLYMNNSIT